jgi:mannose-6-phosphate isomerase-like protein (cupin superfamily)
MAPAELDAARFYGLPGGVGLSYLAVYDSVAPDGERGGTPHVHLASAEAYVVLAGLGRVQTLSQNGFDELSLESHQVVWFSPGTIHRLINDGGLELLVIMQNQGLPEDGDAVITFPPPYLESRARYDTAASLPGHAAADAAEREQRTRERRDLAVEGFLGLRQAFDELGPPAIEQLYRQATALVGDLLPRWRETLAETVVRSAAETSRTIDRLEEGDAGQLAASWLFTSSLDGEPARLGMCGRLGIVDVRQLDRAAGSQS